MGGRLFPLWFKGMAGLLILLLGVVAATDRVLAAEPFPEVQARAHVVMEFDSGLVLDAHRADEPLPPASLTKMMTGYLVLEKIRSGEIDWADPVRISPRAASIDEAQVYLVAGEEWTVRQLFEAMLVYSANDAAVALAEHLAGSEEAFVGWMNEKAKELELTHTHFRNSTGLNEASYPRPPEVEGEHVMSARDAALLARRLLRDFPEVKEILSRPHITFRGKEYPNWNRMLPGMSMAYEGLDGVKTGFTNEAGYCFVGTAERDGMRLVTAVMGTDSQSARFQETGRLLDAGFENYVLKPLISKDKPLPGYRERIPVPNGVARDVALAADRTLVLPVRKDQMEKYTFHVRYTREVKAPLAAGTPVAEVSVRYDGQKIPGVEPVRLLTRESVEEASWVRLFFRKLGDTISSWIE
ncbi:MAG: D-alanyl-D-alanine carboxypeptidase family protein [Planifilum sp.]